MVHLVHKGKYFIFVEIVFDPIVNYYRYPGRPGQPGSPGFPGMYQSFVCYYQRFLKNESCVFLGIPGPKGDVGE